MAKERLFFILSFALLGIIAAVIFRHPSKSEVIAQPPPIQPAEVKEEKLKPKEEIQYSLEPGQIAVPFQLTSRAAIVQFMKPGSFVDVIFTSKPDIDFGSVSLALLRNVRILELGSGAEGFKSDQPKGNSSIEILLEMTLRESEIFSYAEQAGTISFVITDASLEGEANPLVEKLLASESSDNFNSILISHTIASLFPTADVKVIATPRGYIIEGNVPDAMIANKIVKVLEMLSGNGGKAVVNLTQEAEESVQILVAQTDLKAGNHISLKDYAWAKIPAHELKPSFIVKTPQSEKWMHDSLLAKDVNKGQEIQVCDIIWPKESLDLKEIEKQLPSLEGVLAVPFLLPSRSLIIQSLHPGISVDINFTSKIEMGLGVEAFTLLKNIPVLSIRDTQGKLFHGKSSFYLANSSLEVFLGMNRKQAEIFSYALQAGTISLQVADNEAFEKNPRLINQLLQSESAAQFQSVLITEFIGILFPHVNVKITVSPRGYIAEGNVPDPQMAKKIIEILAKLIPSGDQGLINMLHIEPQQVQICVKIYEIEKGLKERLGLNWQAIFNNNGASALFSAFYPSPSVTDPNYVFSASNVRWGKVTLSTLMNMLEEDAYGKLLAEPNLTTISGETAHFFSGGEFPILIPQGGSLLGTVTVEFKKYGVLVDFTPVVELNGLITMHVVPEVSNLDKANSVILNGFVIPALLTRRVDTTVKLWPGQSYLIAGMFLEEFVKTNDNLYGLDRVPIIGPLFSSKKQEDSKTELIVVVTPYLIDNENVCEWAVENDES